jgi:hypothetical protein
MQWLKSFPFHQDEEHKKRTQIGCGAKKKHNGDACSFCATELERRETWRRHRDKDLAQVSKVRDTTDMYTYGYWAESTKSNL